MEHKLENFFSKSMIIRLATGLLFIALFYLVHFSLQNPQIYKATLGKYTHQYVNNNGVIGAVDKPYEKIGNNNLIRWDASHYHNVRTNMYNLNKTKDDRVFAFFPLFPIIWRITQLSPVGMCVLNFLFFIIAICIISYCLTDNENTKSNFFVFLTAISLPTIVMFAMPYAESVFILTFSIALIGLFKKKYWLFFLGLFLFAMTRSAVVIIALSLLGVEIIYLFRHRSIVTFFKRFLVPAIPLLSGTLAVSLFQYAYGSGSLLKFMDVHKYWDHTFKIPRVMHDWSFEGYSLNLSSLFMVTIPCVVFIIIYFISIIKSGKGEVESFFSPEATQKSKKEYLLLLSVIYVVGISLFILFYQGGNIAGAFRYVVCSPFFYIMLFYLNEKGKDISLEYKTSYFGLMFLSAFFVFALSPYSAAWTFADTGFFLLALSLGLALFKNHLPVRLYASMLLILVFANIIWNTYLLNCFLNEGWIFA